VERGCQVHLIRRGVTGESTQKKKKKSDGQCDLTKK